MNADGCKHIGVLLGQHGGHGTASGQPGHKDTLRVDVPRVQSVLQHGP